MVSDILNFQKTDRVLNEKMRNRAKFRANRSKYDRVIAIFRISRWQKDVESLTATDDPSRSVSASIMSAIAAKVNALWRVFHSKTPVAPLRADAIKHVEEMHVFPVTRDDGVETDGQTASTVEYFGDWTLMLR